MSNTIMKAAKFLSIFTISFFIIACSNNEHITAVDETGYPCYSGIYPHLAFWNTCDECGSGAVVEWADRLWIVTYGPHSPFGSDDKLYEITPDLKQIVREESIGGTPANRMIHTASNQLFIGPYAIDNERNVRVMPYDRIPGRHTGMAAHLTDPENRILLATMEAGFYDIDVHTLDAVTLYKDGNQMREEGFEGRLSPLLPGYHGKGFYSGQGVAVYSNNGEEGDLALRQFDIPSGSLSEWNGKDWKVIRRNQFTEITGPDGIYGSSNPESDPIWALGWDYKSIILGCREPEKGWTFYRLPKASFSYDGAHGWNTEWPRIRNVGTEDSPDYLMTMHGMFWRFPGTFSTENSAGIEPRGSYLKVIGDFTRWNDRLVFGCDDSARKEFLNLRQQKGNITGAGQSNSNLWFTSTDTPDNLGPTNAGGAVWLSEDVKADTWSDPFMFDGWPHKCVWLANHGEKDVTFTFETDKAGNGQWESLCSIEVTAKTSLFIPFSPEQKGAWVRVKTDKDTRADVMFSFTGTDKRTTEADKIFNGLAKIGDSGDCKGLVYSLPDNRRALGMVASTKEGRQYYELDGDMNLKAKNDAEMESFICNNFVIPRNVVNIDESSVLIVDTKGRRWRLPLGNEAYTAATDQAELRLCREVSTERDLFSCHGTFYELPAENADGYAKIRPISSHDFAVNDYASYRGMLIMTGIDKAAARKNPHIILSDDGEAAVWAGTIDDLWKIGKPTGHGGPLVNSPVEAGVPSDPYLIGFYDKRDLTLSHESSEPVTFTLEVDPTGDGRWFTYENITVAPGVKEKHSFPEAFQARWIRVKTDIPTIATTWFEYR